MLNCTSKNFSTHTLWFGNDTVASCVNWEHAGSGTRVSVWSQFYKTIKIDNSKFWSSKFLIFCFNLFVLLFLLFFCFVLSHQNVSLSGQDWSLAWQMTCWLKKYYLQLWLANLHCIYKAVEQDHSYLFVEFITAIL